MFRSIVVGTDGSDTATQAVLQAVDLARSVGAKIELVSAYEPVAGHLRSRLEGRVDVLAGVDRPLQVLGRLPPLLSQPLARDAGVTVDLYARQGDPADAILDVAEEQQADLIVVGNKGMTGAKRFLLGSVPNKVSHHAPCSVLIIRTT